MSDSESLEYHSELPGVLGKVDTLISKIESFMLATGVLLMALNTCVNVVARFGFGQGLFFSGEINRILIILITFAGIGYAARHGRHIRMSAVYDMLPFKGRKIVMILISVITAAIMFLLAYFSYQYVLSVFERGRILPALGFEIWWIYIWVPLGFAVTGVQYLLTAYKNATSPEIYLSTGVLDEYTDTKNQK
ncbi:TRAP transporter small permease subunit [Photobacterium halotolerans]|uniref:TRAP transporter small permease protein n=1 Tax=Photobacterium halotolerans TaxID=265726 RepID=A0A7X5BK36_9GAMM|nr:TRAP transporter small permease [Photobacterium halotolerans]NAW66702.1 TRAP transporter small permease subunit [Photobacterium halotolerans]NAX46038.1 TRAP transporter small permease subunit [Photobacterium halotolerans]